MRIKNWEYWPFSLLYFPVFLYYGWLSLRSGSFFFFTAANPTIEFGGMMGEKKSDIFSILPKQYIPKTHLIRKGDHSYAEAEASSIGYPIIVKPDTGERGRWVRKVHDKEELVEYVKSCPVDFLIQELVDYSLELGIFYVKQPGEKSGKVTSVVQKEFLTVVGDGKSTILDLLKDNPRAILTADWNNRVLIKNGNKVCQKGELVVIEPIGNHCRGTKFLDAKEQIDDRLTETINRLADEVPGLHFGRFDIRCKSYEDLKELQAFKILELNGAGAEPSHIYHPGFSLWKAYRDLLWHLNTLAVISRKNHKRGVPYWSFIKGYRKWRSHVKHNKLMADS